MLNNLRFKAKDYLLRRLHSNIIITLELLISDKNGKIVRRYKRHGRSLTGNFLQWMYTNFTQGNIVDFAPSSFNGGSNTYTKCQAGILVATKTIFWSILSLVGNLTQGLVFGTGVTAPTALDYQIETLIPHGTAAGQFSYQQQGASQAPIAIGSTTTFILQRIAVNNSGSAISVTEVALYGFTNTVNGGCIYRDAVSPALNVLATQTITAQITFQVIT